ncbi:MAG: hypothetical protein U1E76_26125 [Planctomycetota bacterium]
MRSLVLLVSMLGAAATSGLAFDGDCAGDRGFVLDLPDSAAIGTDFVIRAEAPFGWNVYLLVSLGQGPTKTDYGTLCLDFPYLTLFSFVPQTSGFVCFTHHMPCDKGLVGLTGYFQFLAIDHPTASSGISNQESLTVLDGDCG